MIPNHFYHIYNRGNNKQKIFFSRENYLYFLRKVKTHFIEHLEIIAYCLMPNHFHFLVYSKESIVVESFSNDLKIMLRSYTRAINKQQNKTGSLFAQNTKVKPLAYDENCQRNKINSDNADLYAFICFHYIHQNPLKAGLVKKMEDWEMGSYRDYSGFRNGNLCNKHLANELIGIPMVPNEFIEESRNVMLL